MENTEIPNTTTSDQAPEIEPNTVQNTETLRDQALAPDLDAEEQDILSALEQVRNPDLSNVPQFVKDISTPAPEPSDDEILRAVDQTRAVGVIAPENIDLRINALEGARGIVTPKDSQRAQQVRQLSKELNVDPFIIDSQLEESSENEIRTKASIPEIARQFPVLSKWAAKPENYVLMENSPDWTKSLTVATQKLAPNDYANAAKISALEYPKAAVTSLLLFGALSPEKAQEALDYIGKQQEEYRVSDEGQRQLDKLQMTSEKMRPGLSKLFEGIRDSYKYATDDDVNTLVFPEIAKTYEGTAESFSSLLDYLGAMYENDKGAKIIATQAAISTIGPLGAGAAGTVVGGPVLGAAGALSIGGMLGISESLQEDLEPFRDPKTGQIDLQLAFSNPERVARWKKRASVYGAVMGVSELIYARYIGKGFSKIFKEGAKTSLKTAGKTLAKDVAAGAAEEGLSQATATVARDAVSGDLTTKTFVTAGEQGITESIYGGMLGSGISGLKVGTTFLRSNGKERYFKMKSALDSATKASNEMFDLHEAKTVYNQDETSKSNSEQVKDLIEDVVNPIPPIPKADPQTYDEVDDVKQDAKTNADFEREQVQGTVQITPSELTTFFEDQNVPIQSILELLPQEYSSEFINNRDNDIPVQIPISEWMGLLEDYPEIDSIVRINGNDFNAIEADEATSELISNPFSLESEKRPGEEINEEEVVQELSTKEDNSPPDIPVTPEQEQAQANEAQLVDGNPGEIIKLSEIRKKLRGPEGNEAFNLLKFRLKKNLKNVKGISPEAIDTFAEVQYSRQLNRAKVTGRDVNDLIGDQTIKSGKSSKVYGYYQPGENKLFFDERATPTTVVHEFGHSWLYEMSDDYTFMANIPVDEMTPDQLEYWYAMEKVADLYNIENVSVINSLPDKELRDIHESFATTTEEYFLSGNFENSRVRDVMESFRKHMIKIMDFIRRHADALGYKVFKPTPEINRMFNGIIGTGQKIDEILTPMFPEPLFDQDALGGNFSEYYNTSKDALAEAVGKFASKIMNSSYKEREQLIDAALNNAYDEASAIVGSYPEMLIDDQMKDQYEEYKAAKKAGKDVSDPRIDYKTFLDLFDGDESAALIAKEIIPNYIIAPNKRAGTPVSIVMYSMGISDTKEFIDSLMMMGTRDDLVEQKANEIIDAKYPVLKSDELIRDEAVDSLSNTKTSKFLNEEMKILADKYLPTLKNMAEFFITPPEIMRKEDRIKNEARETVMNSTLRGFSAAKFRVNYGRLGRTSARFFKKGDFVNAFNDKVKSAISYESFKLGSSIVPQINKTILRIKQINKYTKSHDFAKKYNVEIMAYAKEVIRQTMEGATTSPVLTVDMFPDASAVSQEMLRDINTMVDNFFQRNKGKTAFALRVGAYLELGEIVKSLQKQAKLVREVEVGNETIALLNAQMSISEEVENSKSMPKTYEKMSYTSSIQTMYTGLRSLYSSPAAFAKSIAGKIVNQLENSQANRNNAIRDDRAIIVGAINKILKAAPKGTRFEEAMFPLLSRIPYAGKRLRLDRFSQPIVSDDLGITFSNMGEVISLILMAGSQSGAEKVMFGGTKNKPGPLKGAAYVDGKVDMTPINNLIKKLTDKGLLTKEQFDAIQEIWDMFEQKHPEVRKAFRKTDAFIIGKIEGQIIKTPFGNYQGRYFPVGKDNQLTTELDYKDLLNVDTFGVSAESMYPMQNTGLTKSRNQDFFPVSLDLNKTLTYMTAVNDIIHMRESLKTFGRVFSSQEVQNSLEQKRPGFFKNIMVPWFSKVKFQERSEISTNWYESMASTLQRNANQSLYLFKLLTPLKQVFGLPVAIPYTGAAGLAKYSQLVALNPVTSRDQVAAESSVMQDRFDATIKRYAKEWEDLDMKSDWVSEADQFIEKVAYFPIQMMQSRVDTIIWLAAKDKGLTQGMTQKQAIFYADTAVQATQSSSTVTYRNKLQTAGALSKFIQGFAMSYMFSINNAFSEEVLRQPTKMLKAKAIVAMGLLMYMLPSLLDQTLEEAYKAAFEEGDDDEPEELEDRIVNVFNRAVLGIGGVAIPIVGGAASSFAYSGKISFTPIPDYISRETGYGVSSLMDLANGVELTPRQIRGFLNSISIWTKIPTSALGKKFFVEEVLIGDDLDDRLMDRRSKLRQLKYEEN